MAADVALASVVVPGADYAPSGGVATTLAATPLVSMSIGIGVQEKMTASESATLPAGTYLAGACGRSTGSAVTVFTVTGWFVVTN